MFTLVVLAILTHSYVTNTQHSGVCRIYTFFEQTRTFCEAAIQVSLCVADRHAIWTKAPQLVRAQQREALRFPNVALQIFTFPSL